MNCHSSMMRVSMSVIVLALSPLTTKNTSKSLSSASNNHSSSIAAPRSAASSSSSSSSSIGGAPSVGLFADSQSTEGCHPHQFVAFDSQQGNNTWEA